MGDEKKLPDWTCRVCGGTGIARGRWKDPKNGHWIEVEQSCPLCEGAGYYASLEGVSRD